MDAREKRVDQLRAEVDYRRQRLDLYRARLYGGRSSDRARLTELEKGHESAAERLRAVEAEPPG